MPALLGLLRTMRPKQWTKNLLFVFPAIVFDGKLFEPQPFLRVFGAFALFCLMASTVYIINDLVDLENDRQHPKKKNRPLPSGKLPIPLALGAAIVFPIITLGTAFLFSQSLALILATYFVMQLAYSFWLKHVAIVDVLVVTAGFILRVIAGVVVIEVQNFSPWLYAVTGLLALFLAVGKRRQELISLGENAVNTRPIYEEYNLPLIDDMLRVVTTSRFITYMLYTIESQTRLGSDLMLATVPFVLYGLFRYLYLIHVRGEGSAPDEVLLKDRALQIDIVLFVIANIIIIYVLPRL